MITGIELIQIALATFIQSCCVKVKGNFPTANTAVSDVAKRVLAYDNQICFISFLTLGATSMDPLRWMLPGSHLCHTLNVGEVQSLSLNYRYAR